MKIAILGTAYPYRGGLASLNERLTYELMQKGHDVSLYTFSLQYPDIVFPGKSQYSEKEPPLSINIHQSINSINPINWISFGNRLKKEQPDLIILRFWLPFFGASFGTILRRVKLNGHTKVISIIDNMIPHEKRIGDRLLTNYFIKPVDGFMAMTESVLKDIKKFDTQKPTLISPHPLFDNYGQNISRTEALKKLGLDEGFRYLLFFGLIRKYKGLDLLLEAFSDSHFKNQNLKLLIAGEYYTDTKPYQELIKDYGLEDRIIQVSKYIPDEEVKNYFCASDCLILPYKTATQSGVTQIAYHFNIPMIVTNVGGLAETCPDGKVGYVVEPNVQAIKNAISRFYSDDRMEDFISGIQEEKKKYTWNVLIENIIHLYNQLD